MSRTGRPRFDADRRNAPSSIRPHSAQADPQRSVSIPGSGRSAVRAKRVRTLSGHSSHISQSTTNGKRVMIEERWSLHLISNSLFRRLFTSSRARRHDMVRTFLIALTICLTLTSCYTPNQEALVETVHKRVTVGMPISQAISALSRDGFDCSGSVPVDCVRTRQRLLPSTCIERVRLQHKLWTVDTIDIAPIACAGL